MKTKELQLELPLDGPVFESLADVIRYTVYTSGKQQKYIAADIGTSAASLSRCLSENENDQYRFPSDWIEKLIESTGNHEIIYYLINKYLRPKQEQRQQALLQLEDKLAEIEALARVLRETKDK